ncbi:MAG: type I restriction-modification system subunit M [Clostridia bacterium]|nr:type I restriction-modification system subunit M [Clostridia bacterium]
MKLDNISDMENKLWDAAERMRGAVSVADYKFIVLGLIFLKYISDSFTERYKELVEEGYGLEEERDCYAEKNIFYVPQNARWSYLVEHSKDSNIGEIIDEALVLIEKENKSLKNVLPKNYNSPTMRNVNLGEIIDLFTNINVGTKDAIEKDVLGRIYEYFLSMFAKNELQKGGEFYTPACLVRTMVSMIEPYSGRVYDPACGSGGMFIQSLKFVQEHQGNIDNIGIFGQEKNPTTWRLAKMNLAIRSLNGDLGAFAADTFTEDLHKDLKADFVLANPPFNLDWDADKVANDPRWKFGLAPKTNANYAWLQHMISKLSQNGKMACILANGSLAASGQEAVIRKKMIENDLVDCILAMPTNLFYTVTVPCSIWIINRNKKQKGHTLFIDATKMGTMVTRSLRELSEDEIKEIADTYHAYQNDDGYEDKVDFCKKASYEDIVTNDYALTPGRYIEIGGGTGDDEPFEEKMERLTKSLGQQFEKSKELEDAIVNNLKAIGFEI